MRGRPNVQALQREVIHEDPHGRIFGDIRARLMLVRDLQVSALGVRNRNTNRRIASFSGH